MSGANLGGISLLLLKDGSASIKNREYASLAQLAEQLTLNQRVDGSSPSGGTEITTLHPVARMRGDDVARELSPGKVRCAT